MGIIIVGQKKQKTVNMGGVTIVPDSGVNAANKGGMTAEEKKALVEKIMEMPKDQIVPELRKHGFTDIADITEAQMKEAEKDAQEDAREKRLAEIMALPVDERLPLLLAEGYEDEAKKLSEELAAEQGGESSGNAEDTTAEDGEGEKTETDDGDGDGEIEPEKRKVGRPKKSEE
jgi:hypothetical protein